MSMSDPIADMLTRIRNAQSVDKAVVSMPSSKLKVAIAQVLKDEGYIDGFAVRADDGKSQLEIALKYYAGRPVIERIERVSRPGLRIYKGRDAIPAGHERPGCGDRHHAQGRDDRPQGAPDRCRRRSAVLRRLMRQRLTEGSSHVSRRKNADHRPARRGRVDHGRADHVKGGNGTLVRASNALVTVKNDGGTLTFAPANDSVAADAMSGTMRALVANMVNGVSKGFEKKLTLVGVGFRAQAQGQKLNLQIGFSHPVVKDMPAGIKVETPTQTEILIKGADRQVRGPDRRRSARHPSARALQGQGHPLRRRARGPQRDQEEVRSDTMLNKKEQRLRRSRQTRVRIAQQGVARLTVFRTNLHIYASVISDDGSKVLASASTAEKAVREQLGGTGKGGNDAAAARWSASASPRRPRPPASRRWRSTVRALPTTAASRRWPKRRAKPACSSKRSSEGIQQWQSFNPALRPKATTTA